MVNSVYIVDTNVVLRLLLKDDEVQSAVVRKLFACEQYEFIVPTTVLCEIVWVMKKRYKLSNLFIAEIIHNFVLLSNVTVDYEQFIRGLKFLQKGGDFADGVIAHQVQDYHNASLLTFDKKAQKIATQLNLNCIEPS